MTRLEELRIKAGVSQNRLAQLAGLSTATVRKLELGENKGPTLKTAREIAAQLKILGALKGISGHPVDIVFPWE